MIGESKGYCMLKSLSNVFIGYDQQENPQLYEEIQQRILSMPIRIIDVAVDKSGFLCIEPGGICMIDVRSMEDVKAYFLCQECAGVLLPPDIEVPYVECAKRLSRKGGYNHFIKNMVIANSLKENKFDDSFLFTL